jgi:hypothetical protein
LVDGPGSSGSGLSILPDGLAVLSYCIIKMSRMCPCDWSCAASVVQADFRLG